MQNFANWETLITLLHQITESTKQIQVQQYIQKYNSTTVNSTTTEINLSTLKISVITYHTICPRRVPELSGVLTLGVRLTRGVLQSVSP